MLSARLARAADAIMPGIIPTAKECHDEGSANPLDDDRQATLSSVLATALVFDVAGSLAQAPKQGAARPLSNIKFPPDDDVKCLVDVVENGDPNTGPSTFIMKARPNCVVPAHYHTAEEQLLVVQGEVSTGMEGMSDIALGAGGFAMMPSKQVHWFACTSKDTCLMFVSFDRKYDITWVKDKK